MTNVWPASTSVAHLRRFEGFRQLKRTDRPPVDLPLPRRRDNATPDGADVA